MDLSQMPLPEDAETKIYTPKTAPESNFTSNFNLKYETTTDNSPVKIYHHKKKHSEVEF
jgi:hypothetical protein